MSDKKNEHENKQKKDKSQKEKTKLDKELNQTFPASDPPSRTRPGHERDKKEEDGSWLWVCDKRIFGCPIKM